MGAKERMPAPRFDARTKIPTVSEGMQLVKFHGEPALIPAAVKGDAMDGKSQFTTKQAEALIGLEHRRMAKMQNQRESIRGAFYE